MNLLLLALFIILEIFSGCEYLPISTLSSGIEVQFHQLNWLGDNGSTVYPCSRVGVAEFSVSDHACASGGCYVNVTTQLPGGKIQWSVQNLFLSYPDETYMAHSHPSVQFDLGNVSGTCVQKLNYDVQITSKPSDPTLSTASRSIPVDGRDYLTGGTKVIQVFSTLSTMPKLEIQPGGMGSGNTMVPLVITSWIGAIIDALIDRTVRISIPPDKVAPVEEEVSGCWAGAFARSIAYLDQTNDLKAGDPQEIYKGLKATSAPTIPMIKEKYTKEHNLPITTEEKQIGVDIFVPCDPGVMDALQQGCDIELNIDWDKKDKNDPNEVQTGHTAMVSSITAFKNGACQISYIDDPRQGDKKQDNEQLTITTPAGGDSKIPGGSVEGYIIECIKK